RAGAWVETLRSRGAPTPARSLPARERGLKHRGDAAWVLSGRVAPRAGAWVETASSRRSWLPAAPSLPARERGLKPPAIRGDRVRGTSLPARERGLKPWAPLASIRS